MVGNIYTDHVEVVVDNTPPVLAINYNSPITTDCLPPSWQTSASASDTTPPVTLFYRLNNSTAWYNLPTPFRPALNYSGNLTIIATDGVDNQNTSLLLIPGFDQEPPALNISITNHTHAIELNDDCGEIQSGQFQVEFSERNHHIMVSILQQFCAELFDVFQSTLSCQIPKLRTQPTAPPRRRQTFTASKSIFALNYSTGMVKVGNYLSPTVRFTVTPPTGGSFTTTTQHSTLGQIEAIQPPKQHKNHGDGQEAQAPSPAAKSDQCSQPQTPSIERPWTPTPTSSMAKSHQHQHCPSSARTQSWPTRHSLDQTHDCDWAIWSMQEVYSVKCNATRTDNQAQPSTRPSPTSHQAELQAKSDNYTISCRIKDQVGNYGPYTNFSGVVDLTKPTINYAPAQGSTINDNTTLTITSTDDKINGSSTATITWTSSDGNATWNTTVNYNGTWTGTLNRLNANLTDGTITATINAQDWAGTNAQTPSTAGHSTPQQRHPSSHSTTAQAWSRSETTSHQPFDSPSTTNRRLVHNNHTALHAWPNRKPSNPRNNTKIMGMARKLKHPHQRPNLDQCHNHRRLQSNDRGHLHLPHRWRSHQHQHCPSSARTQSWPTRHSLDQTHDCDWAIWSMQEV